MSSCSIIASTVTCGPGPRGQNDRECRNQPTVLDNFGTCGGVGGLSPAVRQAQRQRASGASGSSASQRTGSCPPCAAGSSVLDSTGAYNCNPNNLTRKQEKDNLLRMFPANRPIYIRRPNNWFIYRR